MRETLGTYANKITHERRTRTCLIAVLVALAVVVAAGVSWQLHYTGIAAANETYCGMEEHTHTDECYSQMLVCGFDESADHTHTDACYETELTCTVPEHIHTVECLIDPNEVDMSHVDWEATLPQLTGTWADDVVAIAQSQLGYTESPADVILDETGELKGYTCYGDWYGSTHGEYDTYADWDATFASFCLNYAGVPESDFPEGSDVNAWIKTLDNSELYVEETQATPGDLIFLDSDKDDVADTVAIVIAEKDGELTLIQGDSNNAVEQNVLKADDEVIIGFGILPEQPEQGEAGINEVVEDVDVANTEIFADAEEATENPATQEELPQTVDDDTIGESGSDRTNSVASNRGEGLVMLDTDDGIEVLSEGMGDKLDGDYAYLTNVMMDKGSNDNGYAMNTGTEPFDGNDDAGNDNSAENDILRTYDTATYTVDMTTNVRSDAPYGTYYEGDLYFEFVVEGTSDEIEWDVGAMGWLESKNGMYTVTTETSNGRDYQVLRGYVTLAPATDDGHAIGATTQTLSLVLRALAMQNGDAIVPHFTFFLAYNDVGLTDDQYEAWGTSSYNGPILTFEGTDCEEHNMKEWQVINAPEITVSAVARYNVKARASSETVVGDFDFANTGNEKALNKDAGTVTGRMGSVGVTIQIVGKSAQTGLRGVELPKEGEPITFELTLDASVQPGSTVEDITDLYTPLIWSYEGNSSANTQEDGRTLPTDMIRKYATRAPLNKQTSSTYYNRCYDGGTWSAEQTGNKVSVTITDWQLMMDLDHLPYCDAVDSQTATTYYNPDSVTNYWDIQYACISGGEFWVVQPFYSNDGNNTYILDKFGVESISITTTTTDSNLSMADDSGNRTEPTDSAGLNNQAVTTDDTATLDMAMTVPGTIDQHIAYKKYNYASWNDPLTDGCWSDPKDWILAGNNLIIYDYIDNDGAEGTNTAVAYDQLVKFDDAFFELERVSFSKSSDYQEYKVSYAAKSDGSGWNHNGLEPDESGYDTEMINATTDDLIYYTSLSALESDGKTCVGVLVETRGLASSVYNRAIISVYGSCKVTAEPDQVYMVTHYAREWRRSSLAEAAGLTSSEILGMSTDDILELVKEYIPYRYGVSVNDQPKYDKYADSPWINGGRDGNSNKSDVIRNYVKASYDENGYKSGATSGNYYGDSCLVVGYQTGLTLNVAQTTTSGGSTHEKSVYDMDTGQTIVDYVASPFIKRNNGEQSYETTATTEVVVTITLPDNLAYIEGSSYIGGTYETNGEGKQGTVTGGTNLSSANNNTATFIYTVDGVDYPVTVHLTVSSDGKTLTYTFSDVPVSGAESIQYLEQIYYSCEISSGAVKNGDELDVTADIYCSSDKYTDPATKDDGEAKVGITVTKNTAISLVKTADQTTVEVDGTIGFTMDVGDNSDNPMTVVAVDNIPYNGDGSSNFANKDCEVYVTEFSTYDVTGVNDMSTFRYFYTTKSEFAKVTSSDYEEGEYFVSNLGESNETVNQECLDDGWVWIKTDDMETSTDTAGHTVYTFKDFPKEPVYAIVAVGVALGEDDISLHVTLSLTDPEPTDSVLNRLTQQHGTTTTDEEGETKTTYSDLTDTARSTVVGRTISGKVWLDEDVDGGIRTGVYSAEQLLEGVTVTLKIKDESGNWVTAQKLKYAEGESADCVTYTDEDGNYEFNYLPEGEYRIIFSGSGVGDGSSGLSYTLSEHNTTLLEVEGENPDTGNIIDDAVNSKVVRYDYGDAIEGILLPDVTQITGLYEVPYQNAGYTKVVPFEVSKVWLDVDGNKINDNKSADSSVTVQVVVRDGNGDELLEKNITLDNGNDWTYTIEDLPYYDGNGSPFDYTVSSFVVNETSGTDGYIVSVGDIKQNDDDSWSVAITNQASNELPNTGGEGTTIFTIVGLLLVGGATALLINRRRKEGRDKEVMS